MNARDRVLGRVRAALADVPDDPVTTRERIPRDYDAARDIGATIPVLADRLRDYRAIVHEIAADAEVEAITAALVRRGAGRVVLPDGSPAHWHTAATEAAARIVPDDPPLSAIELDDVPAVVTGCATAVALTGTIVLDAGAGQGRRLLSLIPDYHLCVVAERDIVGTVPEALARLAADRPLTWISGPSATSDIELNRVEGVHGPRTLEVLIVRT